jgi:hypothetical protein
MKVKKTLFVLLTLVASLLVTQVAQAQLPVLVIEDTFAHDEAGGLNGTTTTTGGATWYSVTNMTIAGEKASHTDVANSGYVDYSAPTDRSFSIEAVLTDRDITAPTNANVALGFSDDPAGASPGANIFGVSSLSLTIDKTGGIHLWDNRFAAQKATGQMLTDVGLANDTAGPIPMRLTLDPVNNRAVGEVNNVVAYDINYTIADSINLGGFGWSSTASGDWDDFAIRQGVPEPATVGMFALGGLALMWARKRFRRAS